MSDAVLLLLLPFSQPPLSTIPQFYFPQGAEPLPSELKSVFLSRVSALFSQHPEGLNLEQFSTVVQEVSRSCCSSVGREAGAIAAGAAEAGGRVDMLWTAAMEAAAPARRHALDSSYGSSSTSKTACFGQQLWQQGQQDSMFWRAVMAAAAPARQHALSISSSSKTA
jgi:hypothetical protein